MSAESLDTPSIKTDTYTTGRGGSGNMAKNDPNNPERARAAQDVTAVPERAEGKGQTIHHGRGGAANIVKQNGAEEGKKDEKKKDRRPSAGLLERAREGLERIRSNSQGRKGKEGSK